MEPEAHFKTWCNRSDRFIGADPLKAAFFGMQYTDFHPVQCMLNPVKMSSVTEPYSHPICREKKMSR